MKKKVISIALVLALALSLAALSGCGSSKVTLNVYNWGMNIADGEDGYIDVIELFEKKYPDITVNYTTYETNEALYTRLKNGGASYDVIIPSDYMIEMCIRDRDVLNAAVFLAGAVGYVLEFQHIYIISVCIRNCLHRACG